MTRSDFVAKLEYFKMVHGVTIRSIATLDENDLDFRPQSGMRTPRELIFHIYTQEKILAEAIREGRFTAEAAVRSSPEDAAVAPELQALVSVNDLKEYVERCHREAVQILDGLSEEKITGPVESPMGTYPGWRFFDFAYDEHWHHRGQLYTYLRLLGKEPPMLYDY